MCVFSSNIYISTFFILSLCVPHFSCSRGQNRLACWFFWAKKWTCPAGMIFNKKKVYWPAAGFFDKKSTGLLAFFRQKKHRLACCTFFLLTHQLSYCSFFGLGNNLHVDRVFLQKNASHVFVA